MNLADTGVMGRTGDEKGVDEVPAVLIRFVEGVVPSIFATFSVSERETTTLYSLMTGMLYECVKWSQAASKPS